MFESKRAGPSVLAGKEEHAHYPAVAPVHIDIVRGRKDQSAMQKKRKKEGVVLTYFAQGSVAGVIQFLGDVIGQMWALGEISDPFSAFAMGLYGFASGIFVFRWYQTVEEIFSRKRRPLSVNRKVIDPLLKMAADQLLVSPVLTLFYLAYAGFVDGKSSKGVIYFVKRSFFPVMLASYKVWPLIQLVNFYFVPLRLRVTFVNTASLLWNAYMKIYRASSA